MPVSFRFVRNADQQEMKLAAIDDEVCERIGATPQKDFNHPLYDGIVNVGIAVLLSQDGTEVTEEKFNAWQTQYNKESKRGPLSAPTVKDLRHFLYETYTFQAWR